MTVMKSSSIILIKWVGIRFCGKEKPSQVAKALATGEDQDDAHSTQFSANVPYVK